MTAMPSFVSESIFLTEEEQALVAAFYANNPKVSRRPNIRELPHAQIQGLGIAVPVFMRVALLAACGSNSTWLARSYVGVHLDRKELFGVLGPVRERDLPERWVKEQAFRGGTWLDWFEQKQEFIQTVRCTYLEQAFYVESDEWYACFKKYPFAEPCSAILDQLAKTTSKFFAEIDALDVCIAAANGLTVLNTHGFSSRCMPREMLVPRSPDNSRYLYSQAVIADDSIFARQMLPGYVPSLPGWEQLGIPEEMRFMDTEASRVFAMGACMYQLLTGRPPYDLSKSTPSILRPLREAPPPVRRSRSDVSESTATLVDRCISKKSSDRPGGLQELREDLEACRRKCRFAQ